jgi:hypothetical protein
MQIELIKHVKKFFLSVIQSTPSVKKLFDRRSDADQLKEIPETNLKGPVPVTFTAGGINTESRLEIRNTTRS